MDINKIVCQHCGATDLMVMRTEDFGFSNRSVWDYVEVHMECLKCDGETIAYYQFCRIAKGESPEWRALQAN